MKRWIDCEVCRTSGVQECTQCNGSGVATNGCRCNHCGGTGIDDCSRCGGTGHIEVEVNDEWVSMGW